MATQNHQDEPEEQRLQATEARRRAWGRRLAHILSTRQDHATVATRSGLSIETLAAMESASLDPRLSQVFRLADGLQDPNGLGLDVRSLFENPP